MIDFIIGSIAEKTPTYVVLNNQGIGYFLNISLHTFDQIKDKTECKLYCQQSFKIEASTPTGMVLFGFADKQERELFQYLTSVSGVGNNTARTMLSALSPTEIIEAILHSEVAVLQRIKGIGSKSAQRIVVDLKDKLSKVEFDVEISSVSHNTIKMETLSALSMLGYSRIQANKAIQKITKQLTDTELTVEYLVKECLKIL